MAFGHSFLKSQQAQNTENTRVNPFWRLTPSERTFRILGPEREVWSYWVKVNVNGRMENRPIVVNRNNPIDQHNARVGRESEDYIQLRHRWIVNVLDRTAVLNMNGKIIYPDVRGMFIDDNGKPITRDSSGMFVTSSGEQIAKEAQELNQVFIWDFGPTMMKSLMALNGRMRAFRNGAYVPLNVEDTDLTLTIEGKNIHRTMNVMQGYRDDPIDQSIQVYDLNDVMRVMPNEAVEELLAGEEYNKVLEKYNLIPSYRKISLKEYNKENS